MIVRRWFGFLFLSLLVHPVLPSSHCLFLGIKRSFQKYSSLPNKRATRLLFSLNCSPLARTLLVTAQLFIFEEKNVENINGEAHMYERIIKLILCVLLFQFLNLPARLFHGERVFIFLGNPLPHVTRGTRPSYETIYNCPHLNLHLYNIWRTQQTLASCI